MPRTIKCRRVCAEPQSNLFLPNQTVTERVVLTVEELEAIRLCDYEGLEQGNAAKIMNISRGTLQRIVYAARRKTAEALSRGKGIVIQGGNYQLASCRCNCSKKCSQCRFETKL